MRRLPQRRRAPGSRRAVTTLSCKRLASASFGNMLISSSLKTATQRRFESDDGVPASISGRNSSRISRSSVFAEIEHPIVVERTAAAEAPRRDDHVVAGTFEHLERVARRLGVKVIVEGVGPEHDALAPRIRPRGRAVPRYQSVNGFSENAGMRRCGAIRTSALASAAGPGDCGDRVGEASDARAEMRPPWNQPERIRPTGRDVRGSNATRNSAL